MIKTTDKINKKNESKPNAEERAKLKKSMKECRAIGIVCAEVTSVLKKRRLDLGLSQRELEGISGLEKSFISMIETNAKVPTLTSLVALTRGLGLEIKITVKENGGAK